MKKYMLLLILIFFEMSTVLFARNENTLKGTKIKSFPFYIYTEGFSSSNHYAPSGWRGDYIDLKINQKYDVDSFSGKTCLQIKYSREKKQGVGWAGIYWQYPANNWGTIKNGYDLTGAKKLIFAARGEKGGEIIEFKMGGINGQYPDSATGTTGLIELTKEWETYEIDLTEMDLNFIISGFCIIVPRDFNPDGCTFYVDEIYYTDKVAIEKIEETLLDNTVDGLRIKVPSIQFAMNSSIIPPEGAAILDRVFEIIKKIIANPGSYGVAKDYKIEIGGHMDDIETPALNIALSKKRALAVQNYLVQKGISTILLTAVGYGKTRPIVAVTPNMTKAQKAAYRAQNRRVEFFIKK